MGRTVSAWGKQPELQVDDTLVSVTELVNDCGCTFVPYINFHGVIFRNRRNFTFGFYFSKQEDISQKKLINLIELSHCSDWLWAIKLGCECQ